MNSEDSTRSIALDETRRAALSEVDNAKFSRFHYKVMAVAGTGFFTSAYDIFSINLCCSMIGYVYGAGQKLSTQQELGLKVATPVGTLIGQLLFGWLADVVGRKRMYGVELIIIIVSTFVQATSGGGPAVSIIGTLIIWRFILGLGVGGDYPLSAVIASEFATTKTRGRMMSAVFAAQGWGNLAATLVALVVTSAYKNSILNDDPAALTHVDYVWRLVIGLGCVPACVALYFRLTIPETPRFTMDVERNVQQAADDIDDILTAGISKRDPEDFVQRVDAPKASLNDFRAYFGQWRNLKVLIGASYSWFALDIAFYGLGLNSDVIFKAINFSSVSSTNLQFRRAITNHTQSVFDDLYNNCVGNVILSAAGLIPGYYMTVLFIDKWGRRPIQLMGFTALTIIFITMGFGYDKLNPKEYTTSGTKAFVFLYCLANFFQNFGPNPTTFVIPGEAFPTRYRSTAHGIAAASGKFGAILAQVGFHHLKDIGGKRGELAFVKHLLQICAFFMFTGIFSTLLLPETMGKTLEELSNESQEGFVKGVSRPAQVDEKGVLLRRRPNVAQELS